MVQFLKDFQHTFDCTLSFALDRFTDDNPLVPARVLAAARIANEQGTKLPSRVTLYRWYNKLVDDTDEAQTLDLNSSTNLPEDLVPTLDDISAYLRKQGLGNAEAYNLLVRASTLKEHL